MFVLKKSFFLSFSCHVLHLKSQRVEFAISTCCLSSFNVLCLGSRRVAESRVSEMRFSTMGFFRKRKRDEGLFSKRIYLSHETSMSGVVVFQLYQQTCDRREETDKKWMEGCELGKQVTESIPASHG